MLKSVKRLREWISSLYTPNSAELKLEGFAIADGIDEEAKDNEKFCDRLREASSERADVTLFGVDYSALPVDADGVPVHIGDYVEETGRAVVGIARGEVIRIVFGKHWSEVRIDTGSCYADRHSRNLRHVARKPTVEDVLREMIAMAGCKIHEDGSCETGLTYEQIAEYASKFRLADDWKEQ